MSTLEDKLKDRLVKGANDRVNYSNVDSKEFFPYPVWVPEPVKPYY